MSRLLVQVRRSTLPILIVLCLAALSVSYAFADEAPRPLATQVIGDPDAAVAGKFAVGTATPGNKALTVVGVIDFLGAGTVHNYFTQGGGNNMQINTNVDEANTVGDATKSQWKLVIGSSLDTFSIRRSAAGGTYDENALFFINGSTGRVGIATVDTGNGGAIPFTPTARLDVRTTSGDGIRGQSDDAAASAGVYGISASTAGNGVVGYAPAASGTTFGVLGRSDSAAGTGVYGYTTASTGGTGVYGSAYASSGGTAGVKGVSQATDGGAGVYGVGAATTGTIYGVYGWSQSVAGVGVWGYANATSGATQGVQGRSDSPSGYGVYGVANATTGTNYGVSGQSASTDGRGVFGWASAASGATYGVVGRSNSTGGTGVIGYTTPTTGTNYGVYGQSASTSGTGVYGLASATSGLNYGVYGKTNSTKDGFAGFFDGNVNTTGDLIVEGDLHVDGHADGFFPRPAYDSGWVALGPGASTTLTHNLGGNPDGYVVDMQCFDQTGIGANNLSIGGGSYWWVDPDPEGDDYLVLSGVYYDLLTSATVSVLRNAYDLHCPEFRLRIWVYR
jgi:hypothetical protein